MSKMKTNQGVMIHVLDDVNRFVFNEELTPPIVLYNAYIKNIKYEIEKLAHLEEIILQQKCMREIDNLKIKLSIFKDYVYARCPFYRSDKKTTKDIRVLVSRVDLIYPDNKKPSLEDLYNDEEFMNKSKIKLSETMREEHEKTVVKYNSLYYSGIENP